MTRPKYITLQVTDDDGKIYMSFKNSSGGVYCTSRAYRISHHFPEVVDSRERYHHNDVTTEMVMELVSRFLEWYSPMSLSTWEIEGDYFDTLFYLHDDSNNKGGD